MPLGRTKIRLEQWRTTKPLLDPRALQQNFGGTFGATNWLPCRRVCVCVCAMLTHRHNRHCLTVRWFGFMDSNMYITHSILHCGVWNTPLHTAKAGTASNNKQNHHFRRA